MLLIDRTLLECAIVSTILLFTKFASSSTVESEVESKSASASPYPHIGKLFEYFVNVLLDVPSHDANLTRTAYQQLKVSSADERKIYFGLFFETKYRNDVLLVRLHTVSGMNHSLIDTLTRELHSNKTDIAEVRRITGYLWALWWKDKAWPDVRVRVDVVNASHEENSAAWAERVYEFSRTILRTGSVDVHVVFSASHGSNVFSHVGSKLDIDDWEVNWVTGGSYDDQLEDAMDGVVGTIKDLIHSCGCDNWIGDGKCYYRSGGGMLRCPERHCISYRHCAKYNYDNALPDSSFPDKQRFCLKNYTWDICRDSSYCEDTCLEVEPVRGECNGTCAQPNGYRTVEYYKEFPFSCCEHDAAKIEPCQFPCGMSRQNKVAIGGGLVSVALVMLVVLAAVVYFCVIRRSKVSYGTSSKVTKSALKAPSGPTPVKGVAGQAPPSFKQQGAKGSQMMGKK